MRAYAEAYNFGFLHLWRQRLFSRLIGLALCFAVFCSGCSQRGVGWDEVVSLRNQSKPDLDGFRRRRTAFLDALTMLIQRLNQWDLTRSGSDGSAFSPPPPVELSAILEIECVKRTRRETLLGRDFSDKLGEISKQIWDLEARKPELVEECRERMMAIEQPSEIKTKSVIEALEPSNSKSTSCSIGSGALIMCSLAHGRQ